MYIAYHQVAKQNLPAIMKSGVKTKSSGEKTDDFNKTVDQFIDSCRPKDFSDASISREKANYCYIAVGENSLIDIVDGVRRTLSTINSDSSKAMLKIRLDPTKCFVSDLTAYDKIQKMIMADKLSAASEASRQYWRQLIAAAKYDPKSKSITRPELLVPYDIPPEDIMKIYD